MLLPAIGFTRRFLSNPVQAGAERADGQDVTQAQSSGARSPARILVVEDDQDISTVLCEVLEGHGYAADAVENGREALAWLRTPGHRPALILLDLRMPVMCGPEFRRWQCLDPQLADIPVLLLSADHRADEVAKALGVAGFLAKPFDLDALLAAVAWQVHGADRRGEAMAASACT